MRVDTIKGCSYVLSCSGPCQVYAIREDGGNMRLVNAEDEGQYPFVAPTNEVDVSDNTALVTRSFSSAPVGLAAVRGAIERISRVAPDGGLEVGGALNANGGVKLQGNLYVDGGVISAEVLRSACYSSALYYGYQYEWSRANIVRDFTANGAGLKAIPDETPEPAGFAALTNGTGLFSESTLVRLPSAWVFDNLVTGEQMFVNTPLESLPDGMVLGNLTNGRLMFGHITASRLPEGLSLANLSNGRAMFTNAPNLTGLPASINLSALTDGYQMFLMCKLDKASVLHVLGTLGTVASGSFGIGVAAALQGDADISAAVAEATAKGWTVDVRYN